jgi:hypothetical protein
MSVYIKRILFGVAGLVVLGSIGVWNPEAQRLIGCFAMGWVLIDIASGLFPEAK